jgi:hypothetical protein
MIPQPLQSESTFPPSVFGSAGGRLANLVWIGLLLLLVNCTANVGAGHTGGTGSAAAGSGGAGNAAGAAGSSPTVTPGANGGLGTVDIVNSPAKAISRLTNAQFIHSAAALLGDAAVVGADALLPEQATLGGFRNSGFAQGLPLDLVKGFSAAAAFIVAHVTDWPALYQRWGPCIVGSQAMTPAQQACMTTFILNFGEAAFRRPTTMQDVAAFQPILDASIAAALTSDETVQLLVRAFLQFPEFLYLFEDATLNDFQLASRISYFLTDGPPDAQLYAAAKAGDLNNPGGFGTQVDRLLALDMTRFARAFSYDYLELEQTPARNVNIDPATINALISSATDTFAALVNQNQPISSILTVDTYAANPATATWIAGQTSTATTVKATKTYPFVGLLTHPATLIAMSSTLLGSTVSRGQFVAYQMLCLPATPPPPVGAQMTDLSASLPPNPTERDQAQARAADPRCKGCHSQFESYSFALNKWGGDGLFKSDPRLDDNGPITTSLGPIAFAGYADFLPQIANSAQFERCLADRLIRYGLQHTEYPPDLVQTILKNAGAVTFRSMIRALVLQTIFTTR